MKMHPAKALEAAVFALAALTPGQTVTVRNSDITVSIKCGRYNISAYGTEFKVFGRHTAIDTIEQLLSN